MNFQWEISITDEKDRYFTDRKVRENTLHFFARLADLYEKETSGLFQWL